MKRIDNCCNNVFLYKLEIGLIFKLLMDMVVVNSLTASAATSLVPHETSLRLHIE